MTRRFTRFLRKNSIALIALFFALSGTTFAAANALGPNTVGAKQLKKNAVTNKKIAKNAVTGVKVKNNSITGADVLESSLAKVPSATAADSAPPSGAAGGALSGTYPNPGLAPMEAWHEVGATGEPTFQNGWTNFGSPWTTMAFAKDSAGFVHLKGTISAGTFGATVFTLPAGYRPAQNLFMPVAAERNAYVMTTGSVEILQEGTNTTGGFDGLAFKAA